MAGALQGKPLAVGRPLGPLQEQRRDRERVHDLLQERIIAINEEVTTCAHGLAQNPHLVLQGAEQLNISAITWSEVGQDRNVWLDSPQQRLHVPTLPDTQLQHEHLKLLGGTERGPGSMDERPQNVPEVLRFNLQVEHGERETDLGVVRARVGAYPVAGTEQLAEQAFHNRFAARAGDSDHQRFFAAQKHPR